jgi:hypothetical protein
MDVSEAARCLGTPRKESSEMKPNWTATPGMLLLGIWLILMNLAGLVPLIASLGILLNALGIAAGVLILMGR